MDRNSVALCLPDPVRQISGGRSQLRASPACCTDLCETEPDSQQVLRRERGAEGHWSLLHTECHLKFRLLCTYTYTNTHRHTHIFGACILVGREKRLISFFFFFFFCGTENRNAAKSLFSSVRCRETKFDQIKSLCM